MPKYQQKHKGLYKSISIFNLVNIFIMVSLSITILYPFLYVLKQSFLDSTVSSTISLSLVPDSFSLSSYERVLTNTWIGYGFINTIK
jgi:ABC-type glycerol-3-phosphate transport system permease component